MTAWGSVCPGLLYQRKYSECILLFMNNNNWWFHVQVCGHDDEDLVLNVYGIYVPNPNGQVRGVASFWRRGHVATSFWRRGGVTVVSCARWDSSDMSTEELKVNNCYHNDILPTPARAKVTATCCPKYSHVEMSLTHRCLSETGDTLCSMLLKFYAFCETNKSAWLR